jgi:hypothetical protein
MQMATDDSSTKENIMMRRTMRDKRAFTTTAATKAAAVLVAMAALAAVVGLTAAMAADKPADNPATKPDANGFVSIFNGKDLTGWDAKPGWWSVEDGALMAQSTPDKPCKECNYIIWTGGKPGDFELTADFKLSLQGNSGIQIRSETRPNWDTFGYQADMTGDGGLVGFIYHHKRGMIVGCGQKAVIAADGKKTDESLGDPAELIKKNYKKGEWNTYRIVCRGPEISLYINGVRMSQVTDNHATEAASKGIIALQMHPGEPMKVQFKDIRLKKLD